MEPSRGPVSDSTSPGSASRSAGRLSEGALVDGRYRVDQAVGAGGFGVVYAARHIGLGAKVALKVLDLKAGLAPEALAARVGAFLEEARTLRRLRHPNIVAALDVGFLPPDPEGRRVPYLVMEWCQGPTLRRLLDERRGAPMPLGEAWALFAPLLAAIEHAHGAGVVHRDLKPENVLIDWDGKIMPRVVDFGLAKIVAPDETAGSGATRTTSDLRAFTPRYAAPEQLLGARTGPWTDVHALGLVFVEIVTGQPAFDGDEDTAMRRVDPVRPTPGIRGVDVGAMEPVLARALALHPADRYPDAGAFGRAMRDAIASAAGTGAEDLSVDPQAGALSLTAAPEAAATDRAPFDSTLRDASSIARGDASHAASTTSPLATTEPTRPVRKRPSPWRRTATALVLVALSLAAALVFSAWKRGPYSHARLREIPVTELERRLTAAGLGACRTYGAGSNGFVQHQISCEQGTLFVLPGGARPGLSEDELTALAKRVVVPLVGDGPAQVAVDGDKLLVAIGPNRGQAIFDAALDDAHVDFRRGVGGDRAAPQETGSGRGLAAWTPGDLLSAVQSTGEPILSSYANGSSPYIAISKGAESATVFLVPHASLTLASMKRGSQPFAYAVDDDTILVVMGSPGYASEAFVRRVLGETRASAIGQHPSP